MSEVGFTKGPWSWFMTGDDRAIYIGKDLFGKSNTTVATIDSDDYLGEKQQKFLSNAHLIAAAPDLYEALECLIRIADDGFSFTPISVAIQLARSALAKARGETA